VIYPRLYESKSVGRHKGAKSPWTHHAVVAIARASFSPKKQRTKEIIGSRSSDKRFAALEAKFKTELHTLFLDSQGGTPPSSKKMKKIFRRYYRTSFQLGRVAGGQLSAGTYPPLKKEDIRWLENFLRKEFRFWKKLITTNKTAVHPPTHRIDLYAKTLRSAYNSARVLETPPQTLFYWVMSPAEHCPQCTYLANHSPYTKANLPAVPQNGETKCLSNCKCKIVTRHVGLVDYYKVARNAPTRQTLIRELKAAGR